MSGSDLILLEDEYTRLSSLSQELLAQSNAAFVGVIDRNGQPLHWCGEVPDCDRTALASLAAGNVAATEGLAQMVGETSITNLHHEGESAHIHMSTLGSVGILVVAFDERSSLGLVQLRVRQLGPQFVEVFDGMVARSKSGSADNGMEIPQITDADIESLFGEGF